MQMRWALPAAMMLDIKFLFRLRQKFVELQKHRAQEMTYAY